MKTITSRGFTRFRPAQGNTVKIAEAFKTREAFRHRSAEEPARLDLMSIPKRRRPSPRLWIRCDRPIVAAGLVPVWRARAKACPTGLERPRPVGPIAEDLSGGAKACPTGLERPNCGGHIRKGAFNGSLRKSLPKKSISYSIPRVRKRSYAVRRTVGKRPSGKGIMAQSCLRTGSNAKPLPATNKDQRRPGFLRKRACGHAECHHARLCFTKSGGLASSGPAANAANPSPDLRPTSPARGEVWDRAVGPTPRHRISKTEPSFGRHQNFDDWRGSEAQESDCVLASDQRNGKREDTGVCPCGRTRLDAPTAGRLSILVAVHACTG
jgi:hypothetical protein